MGSETTGAPPVGRDLRRALQAVVAYLALTAIGAAAPAQDLPAALVVPIAVGLHVALGFAVGRWWAIPATLWIPIVALPEGTDRDGVSIALMSLVYVVPPAALLVAWGVGLRRWSAGR